MLDWILVYLVVFFFVWLFQHMITFFDTPEKKEADITAKEVPDHTQRQKL
jgi:hypothetical protein